MTNAELIIECVSPVNIDITDESFFRSERNKQNGRDFYKKNKETNVRCDVCQTCFKLPYLYRHRKTKKHIKLTERFG